MSLTLKDLVRREFNGIDHRALLNGNDEERVKVLQRLSPGEYVFIPMHDVNTARQNLRDAGLKIDIDPEVSNDFGGVGLYLGESCPMERILMVYRRK